MNNSATPGTSYDVPVLGSSMHVVESGVGEPVVFLHGNPTSSFLWREVTPLVAAGGYRCLAVDLIGMGRSGKPDIAYRFSDHADYVTALLDVLAEQRGLQVPAVLVGHDWGAVLALHQARRTPGNVRAVALCEGHLHPIDAWEDMGEGADMFRQLRAPGTGERMVLEQNFFVEQVVPGGMKRTLTHQEMDAYRAPFAEPASRRPVLAWIREIPICGSPADMVETVIDNQEVIADTAVPILVMHGDPGAVVQHAEIEWCRQHGKSVTVRGVGPGLHFLPEDRPTQIAAALLDWLGNTPGRHPL